MAAYRGATAIDVSGSWQEVSGNSMTFTGISTSANSMLLALLMDRDGPGVGININLTATTGLTQRLNGGGYYFQGGLAELLNADSSNRIWTTTSSQFIANGILFSII